MASAPTAIEPVGIASAATAVVVVASHVAASVPLSGDPPLHRGTRPDCAERLAAMTSLGQLAPKPIRVWQYCNY